MKVLKVELDLKTVLFIVLLVFTFFFLRKVQSILTPFAVSFFIAYLLDPLVDRLEGVGIKRWIAVLIVFLFFSILLIVVFILIIPVLITEINSLVAKIPVYLTGLEKKLADLSILSQYKEYLEELKSIVFKNMGKISSLLLQTVGFFKSYIGNTLNFILLYSIVPILVFYFLKDFDMIVLKLKEIAEKKGYTEVIEESEEFNKILQSYFRGQFIVSVFLGIMYSVVLFLVGIDGALFIGLTSGILSMVPYLGFVVGFGTSLIFAIIQFQDILHPLLVVIGFVVVQLIESNFLTPKIIGESLGLHPVVVIFSIMAGGMLFGLAGMIFSLPVAAFLKVLVSKKLSIS